MGWSPDGKTLASGSRDSTVRIWDASSGKLLRTLEGHTSLVQSVGWSPDGKALASGSSDDTVRIWGAPSGKLLRTLKGHTDYVRSVGWSPNGNTLASGSSDKTVRIWDAPSGKLLRTLEGHTDDVRSVGWSPDGKTLASGSDDKTVRIWDALSGDCLGVRPIARPTHQLLNVAFFAPEPLSASCGITALGDPDLIVDQIDDFALDAAPDETTQVVSAKIVLVGESNVGKSYLAHRMVTGDPPAEGSIKSTHGMKFWSLVAWGGGELCSPRTIAGGHGNPFRVPISEPGQLCDDAKTPPGQRREVVLWDMGGQEEYRLVHQLFLHDTTVALLLLDPTRGATACKETETWNKYLAKQLGNRPAQKLLVGAKLDQPSAMVDGQALDRLRGECGCAGYYETSAITNRGLPELCQAIAAAIDWDGLGKTSRPELFQRIRDQIEARRQRGEVVLPLDDLHRALSDRPATEAERSAVRAVTEQLAAQGVIAYSQVATGEPVLVLQIQAIEQYAGSLILAARNNPRGVPALELRTIGQPDFTLPGIASQDRLPRLQERAVLECTVRLLLEHGICFEHEGLLIFPTLFASAAASETDLAQLAHAVSLYYDFAGAIDNIYASLVCWLVLARDFGQLRLWRDRAEFEVKDGGLCGLRKVARPGGFAHVDVYFEAKTPEARRDEFISFVEDHLRKNGVEIFEHVAIKCPCGNNLAEDVLRQRIARGDKDIACPVCETRHSLSEGATAVRKREPKVAQHTWALKGLVEKASKTITRQVVQILGAVVDAKPTRPIRLLHLSDLHFDASTPVPARLQWLLDDLKLEGGLGFSELDYLVVSGDFTDKGCPEGFAKAYEFLSGLTQRFALSAERCILVPGNHDLAEPSDAYARHKDSKGLPEGEWFQEGRVILARDRDKYPLRLKPFSDDLHHKFLQRPYPMNPAEQGISIPFWETGIQFLTFNSCWEIDEFHRKRAGIHPEAVAHALEQAQQQKETAIPGQPAPHKPLLRIAVWHHAVTAPDYKMKDLEFLGNLQKNGVRLALHGDVHEMRRDLFKHWDARKVHIVGSGSFGARAADRAEAVPRLYNVLEIARDFSSVRVHTREQRKPDGDWQGWHEWDDPKGGNGKVPYYDISLSPLQQ